MTVPVRLTAVLLVALQGCAAAAPESPVTDGDDPVRAVLERVALAETEGASGVLRITHGDTLLVETGFGSASCTEDVPVTPGHAFMIGSITKEYTRILGFVLEERGVLSLDDTLSDVMAGFHGPFGRVTLRQLLDHTGGLPDLIDENGRTIPYSIDYDYEPVSRDELVRRAQQAHPISSPGEQEQYSNLGYQLLAAVYEIATGETYPALLRRYVLAPAGIEQTDFWFKDGAPPTIADGCLPGGQHWGNPVDDRKWGPQGPSWNLIGAGGLLSTAESLGHFFEGIGAGVYFRDSEQLERYKASRMVYSSRRQQRVMGPAGSNGIFNAVAFWADRDRFNVILLTNRADHPAENGLIQDIIRLFPPDRFPH